VVELVGLGAQACFGRIREMHPPAEAAVQIETKNTSLYACYLCATAGATLGQ
jgi:hypothetical protein